MNEKKKIFIYSLILPTLFVVIIWLIKLFEYTLDINFTILGILPRDINGLLGILTMPFIHGGFEHLISNSVPIFILAVAIIYFYRGLGYKVISIIWIVSGILTWSFARPDSYHIGASGLVYGFAAFLFLSGILRNDRKLLAISLAVAFGYGSMIWGIFPIDPGISWEGHLMGMISGGLMAIWYRHEGPRPKKWSWEIEEEEEKEEEERLKKELESQANISKNHLNIVYTRKDIEVK